MKKIKFRVISFMLTLAMLSNFAIINVSAAEMNDNTVEWDLFTEDFTNTVIKDDGCLYDQYSKMTWECWNNKVGNTLSIEEDNGNKYLKMSTEVDGAGGYFAMQKQNVYFSKQYGFEGIFSFNQTVLDNPEINNIWLGVGTPQLYVPILNIHSYGLYERNEDKKIMDLKAGEKYKIKVVVNKPQTAIEDIDEERFRAAIYINDEYIKDINVNWRIISSQWEAGGTYVDVKDFRVVDFKDKVKAQSEVTVDDLRLFTVTKPFPKQWKTTVDENFDGLNSVAELIQKDNAWSQYSDVTVGNGEVKVEKDRTYLQRSVSLSGKTRLEGDYTFQTTNKWTNIFNCDPNDNGIPVYVREGNLCFGYHKNLFDQNANPKLEDMVIMPIQAKTKYNIAVEWDLHTKHCDVYVDGDLKLKDAIMPHGIGFTVTSWIRLGQSYEHLVSGTNYVTIDNFKISVPYNEPVLDGITHGMKYKANDSVTLTATNVDGAKEVKYYADGEEIGCSSNASDNYKTSYTIPEGISNITSKAFYGESKEIETVSDTITIKGITAPVVDVDEIYAAGSEINLTATNVENNFAANVTYYNGNDVIGSSSTKGSKYSVAYTLPEGTNSIKAVVTYNNDVELSSETVTVKGLTKPLINGVTAGGKYGEQSKVTLTAANIEPGYAAEVTYYAGETEIGKSSSADNNYSVDYTVAEGTNTVKAIVKYNTDLTMTSDNVEFEGLGKPVLKGVLDGQERAVGAKVTLTAENIKESLGAEVTYYNGEDQIGMSYVADDNYEVTYTIAEGANAIKAVVKYNNGITLESAVITVKGVTTPVLRGVEDGKLYEIGDVLELWVDNVAVENVNVTYYVNSIAIATETDPKTIVKYAVPTGEAELKAVIKYDENEITSTTVAIKGINAPTLGGVENNKRYGAGTELTLTASNVEEGHAAEVTYYAGETEIGKSSKADDNYAVKFTVPENGEYAIKAVAGYDMDTKLTSDTITVRCVAKPVLKGISTGTVVVGDKVTLTTENVEPNMGASVTYYYGDKEIGTSQNATDNYAYEYTVTEGAALIKAVVIYSDGLNMETEAVNINVVENVAPTVEIISPKANALYNIGSDTSKMITFKIKAEDSDGTVESVAIYDGENFLDIAEKDNDTYQATVILAKGRHSIHVIATDNRNAATTATATINLSSWNENDIINTDFNDWPDSNPIPNNWGWDSSLCHPNAVFAGETVTTDNKRLRLTSEQGGSSDDGQLCLAKGNLQLTGDYGFEGKFTFNQDVLDNTNEWSTYIGELRPSQQELLKIHKGALRVQYNENVADKIIDLTANREYTIKVICRSKEKQYYCFVDGEFMGSYTLADANVNDPVSVIRIFGFKIGANKGQTATIDDARIFTVNEGEIVVPPEAKTEVKSVVNNSGVIKVTAHSEEAMNMNVYVASYSDSGALTGVVMDTLTFTESGDLTSKELTAAEGSKIRVMVWTENMQPIDFADGVQSLF